MKEEQKMTGIPQVGTRFMVGVNKRVNDRSYTNEVFECVAVNGYHVQGKRLKWKAFYEGDFVTFLQPEHDFYSAEGFEVETRHPDKVKAEQDATNEANRCKAIIADELLATLKAGEDELNKFMSKLLIKLINEDPDGRALSKLKDSFTKAIKNAEGK